MILKTSHTRLLRSSLLVAFATTASGLFAQNLVPNPSFEQVPDDTREKDIKAFGLVNPISLEWSGATDQSPDLFLVREKESKVSAPCNSYGYQEPKDGDFYAGFVAYSKTSKLKRSYLQVQLTEKLEENQMYCVSFDISLADLSRYAVPDIGAVLSDRKIEKSGTNPIIDDPDVRHKSNKTMIYRDGWETVCGTVTGSGEEEFLIIGCFGGDASIEEEKVSRPSSNDCFQEKTPISAAYYYIDNVKVEPIIALSECKCGQADERDENMVYNMTGNPPDNATPKQIIEHQKVYYAFLKRLPNGAGRNSISTIAAQMSNNPGMNLEIQGHCDIHEVNEGKINARYRNIGKTRAEKVKDKLVEAGIDASRLTVVGVEDQDLATTLDTEISHAQNRRVTFKVK